MSNNNASASIKERPILFSAPMVRALLAGTKTQTRRIAPVSDLTITPHGPETLSWRVAFSKPIGRGRVLVSHSGGRFTDEQARRIIASQFNRYGVPGDRLWVRETWLPDPPNDGTWCYTSWAGCSDSTLADIPEQFRDPEHCLYRSSWSGSGLTWKPSIHMPRWASRITLEITGVRVERLQAISEADAIAEGCTPEPFPKMWQGYYSDGDSDGLLSHTQTIGDEPPDWLIEPKPVRTAHLDRSARDNYRDLWIALNGLESWEANPWVWVLEFRRIDHAGCALGGREHNEFPKAV